MQEMLGGGNVIRIEEPIYGGANGALKIAHDMPRSTGSSSSDSALDGGIPARRQTAGGRAFREGRGRGSSGLRRAALPSILGAGWRCCAVGCGAR